jgi:hypothetical protein
MWFDTPRNVSIAQNDGTEFSLNSLLGAESRESPVPC